MKSRWRKVLLVILGSSIVGVSVLLVDVSAATRAEKREEIQSQLKNAATAEESFRTRNESYTRVLNNLKAEGFQPNRRVSVLIARAGEGCCIEAQHTGLGEIWRYSSNVGRPLRGRC